VHRKTRVGEKTPGHNRYLSTLLRWFPDSRILFTVRDPRDVVASLLDTPWGPRHGVDLHALEWRRTMMRMDELHGDKRVRPVRYEALVEEPREAMESVCAFLEEDFDPVMTDVEARHTVEGVSREGWAEGHLEKARGPITTSSMGRWRERLTDRQIRIVEDVVGDEMMLWGYHPATDGLSRVSSEWLAVTRLFRRTRGWIQRRNRPQNER
jgi:hypothetical protein